MKTRVLPVGLLVGLSLLGSVHAQEPPERPMYEVRGRLLDACTRRPLEGDVAIEVWPKWESKIRPAGYGSAETGEDGTFVIGELPYGPASIVGRAKDHGREFMLVFIEPDMPELEVLLPIGACIKGILYDDEGLVPDARVAVRYIERAIQILRREYLETMDRAADERFRGMGPGEGQWESGKHITNSGSEGFWPIGTFDFCDIDPDRPFQLVLVNRDRPSLGRPDHVFEEIIMLAPGEHETRLLKIER